MHLQNPFLSEREDHQGNDISYLQGEGDFESSSNSEYHGD